MSIQFVKSITSKKDKDVQASIYKRISNNITSYFFGTYDVNYQQSWLQNHYNYLTLSDCIFEAEQFLNT